MSLVSCKQLIDPCPVQSKIDLQSIDSDIQKDFMEVWMNIEESIHQYEFTCTKPTLKKSLEKKSITNLNLKL